MIKNKANTIAKMTSRMISFNIGIFFARRFTLNLSIIVNIVYVQR